MLKPHSRYASRRPRDRRGAMLVLIAFLLVAFFITVIFSVDVAFMHLVNSQLRSATDAAAKAATDTLSRTEDVAAARQAAKDIAALNLVAGRPLILDDADIVFGSSNPGSGNSPVAFIPGGTPVSATRISGRKTAGSPSGDVALFFGGLIGTPRYETSLQATASRRDRDICLVVDRSGSMFGTKMADLKDAVTVFLATLGATPQDEFVGLASYSSGASLDQSLTTNLPLVDSAMRSLNATGRTNIGGGIDVGRQILNNGRNSGFVEKTMILMTDGKHNIGTSPESAAGRAVLDGIVIHTITFGGGADKKRMEDIALQTGGTFNHAPNGEKLKEIYREIALTLLTQLTE